MQHSRCRDIRHLPLHDTSKEGEPLEVPSALLHVESEESDYGLHAARACCRVRELPLLRETKEGGDAYPIAHQRPSERHRHRQRPRRTCDVTMAHLTNESFGIPGGVVGVPASADDVWATSSFFSFGNSVDDTPSSFLFLRTQEGVVGESSLVSSSSADAQSSFLFLRTQEGVVGVSPFVSSSVDGALFSFSSLRYPEGVAGESPIVMRSLVDDDSYSFFCLRTPEGVVGESPIVMRSLVDDDSYSFSGLRTPEGVVGESPFASSNLVDGAPYSFLPSVAHGGGGSSNDLPAFCDGGGSGGLGVAFGRVNYFHLPVTSLASVPYHIDPPLHEIVSSHVPAAPPWGGTS